MDKNLFITQLDENTSNTLQLLKSLTTSQLEFKESGKWNILEILEHLYLSERLIAAILSKPSENIHANKEVYGRIKLKTLMLDERDNKISSPELLQPKGTYSTIAEAEKAFVQQRNTLKNLLIDEKIIIDNRIHKHPVLGEMTISDWLNFIVHHTERHIEQMKENVRASRAH